MQTTVKLETPIVRGEQTISEIILIRPNSGALRGASLADLVRMDVNALTIVLPRISTPPLTPADVAAMDPSDLLACGLEVSGFFQSKADRALLYPIASKT